MASPRTPLVVRVLVAALPTAFAAAALSVGPLAPSPALKSGFQKVGEQLTQDWLKKAGAEGQGIVDAYKKM